MIVATGSRLWAANGGAALVRVVLLDKLVVGSGLLLDVAALWITA
jgi:hypothetical protein